MTQKTQGRDLAGLTKGSQIEALGAAKFLLAAGIFSKPVSELELWDGKRGRSEAKVSMRLLSAT
jgi:hypothetical protein